MWKLNYYIYCLSEKTLYRSPYIRYKRDKKFSCNEFSFFNFWYNFNFRDFRISRYIEHNNLNECSKIVNFISVFWNRKVLKYINGIKIFFTWEYIGKDRFPDYDDYLLNDVDLSIWFREYEWIDNYIRLPLRILYLFDPTKTTLEDINHTIESLERAKLNFLDREKFCALISSHDDIERTRTKAFEKISKYWKIDCPWKLLHNIDVNIPNYEDKINFLKEYKYNICPENKEDTWYVTEKLIDSWKAWCIPVYKWEFWELEKKVFNEDCLVWLDNLNSKNFHSNMGKTFVENKIFRKWGSEYIYETFMNLERKLVQVLK